MRPPPNLRQEIRRASFFLARGSRSQGRADSQPELHPSASAFLQLSPGQRLAALAAQGSFAPGVG